LGRNLSKSLIKSYEELFPHLILSEAVFDTILDVVSALHANLSSHYDGQSCRLQLSLSQNENVFLPVKHAERLECLAFLAGLLQAMIVKGAILDQDTVWTNFEKFE